MANSIVVTLPVITAPAAFSRVTTGRLVAGTPLGIEHQALRGRRTVGHREDVLDPDRDALQRAAVDAGGEVLVGAASARSAASSNRAR